jgi:putative endonuclease
MPRHLFVYILANKGRDLYTGATSNLARRLEQHRSEAVDKSYTARKKIDRLVYFERVAPPDTAIARERQIKGWTRRKRVELVESVNPSWRDLSETEWLDR